LADRRTREHTRLSAPERLQRARIATAVARGKDPTPERRIFDELQATRQLREAAERLVAARRAQGLPEGIEDPATLARIASLLIAGEPAKKVPA